MIFCLYSLTFDLCRLPFALDKLTAVHENVERQLERQAMDAPNNSLYISAVIQGILVQHFRFFNE